MSPTSVRACAFSARQHDLLALAADGLTDKELAGRLTISSETVGAHWRAIFQKAGVHTRCAAVAVWLRAKPPAVSELSSTCTLQNARLSKAAKVLYPYHPLFGKELEVFGGAGGQRDVIYVKLPNNTTRGVPAWMFDDVICSRVRMAEQPVIGCDALLRLAQLLDSFGASPRTGGDDNNFHSQTKSTSTATPAANGAAAGISRKKPTHPGQRSDQVRTVAPAVIGERRSPEALKPRRQQ